MANNFQLISSSTVGSGGSTSIDFTSIPSTYTDLCIKVSARSDTSDITDLAMRLNGDTASNYFYLELTGNASSASSGSGNPSRLNTILPGNTNVTANIFNNVEIYITNYASSNQKTISTDAVTENNSTSTNVQQRLQAWRWSGTSAITSVSLYPPAVGVKFLQYTTAYLYGISKS